jgi:hypothetical protein
MREEEEDTMTKRRVLNPISNIVYLAVALVLVFSLIAVIVPASPV